MKTSPLVQLEELLSHCGTVTIERTGLPCEYEVTTYSLERDGGHSHHGGATLAEAINRATRICSTSASSQEKQ